MGKGVIKRDLTECEELIMKIVWDGAKKSDMVLLSDVQPLLFTRYRKDYARTTIVTFIARLKEKGYVEAKRIGRFSYLIPLKTEDVYVKEFFESAFDFWLDGDIQKIGLKRES